MGALPGRPSAPPLHPFRPDPASASPYRYSPDWRVVRFPKGSTIGLRLAGGNDVGIFVSGVQEGSPADGQGIQEGDEILQVTWGSRQWVWRPAGWPRSLSWPVCPPPGPAAPPGTCEHLKKNFFFTFIYF